MGVGVLPYDAEVEYLSVDATRGKATIHTGTYPCDESSYYLDIQTTSVNNCLYIIRSPWVSEAENFLLGFANNNESLYWDYGSGAGYNRIRINPSQRWWNNRRLKLQLGNRYIIEELTGYSASASQVSFPRKTRELNVIGVGSGSKLYALKIYERGIMLRDFIPVRAGTTGYLYDRANPTGGPLGNGLYPNSGSGVFVIGPDVA